MLCKKCGHEFEEQETCPQCGAYTEDPAHGRGIAAMILGYVSLGLSCVSCFQYITPVAALIASIVGIILANSAINDSENAGFVNEKAITGLKFSKIGLLVSIICIACWLLIIIAFILFYFGVLSLSVLRSISSLMETVIQSTIY